MHGKDIGIILFLLSPLLLILINMIQFDSESKFSIEETNFCINDGYRLRDILHKETKIETGNEEFNHLIEEINTYTRDYYIELKQIIIKKTNTNTLSYSLHLMRKEVHHNTPFKEIRFKESYNIFSILNFIRFIANIYSITNIKINDNVYPTIIINLEYERWGGETQWPDKNLTCYTIPIVGLAGESVCDHETPFCNFYRSFDKEYRKLVKNLTFNYLGSEEKNAN